MTCVSFGAHALKAQLSVESLAVFEVGVRYQVLHAGALLAVAWASTHWSGKAVTASGCLLAIGTALFSGSLYVLSLGGVRAFAVVTPVGGLALLAGWACLAWAAWQAPAKAK